MRGRWAYQDIGNRETNKELVKARNRAHYEANRDKVLARQKMYRENNKAKISARNKVREAEKLRATPAWVDRSKVEEFYAAADFLGMVTGEWYHVDHIVPLRSKTVCGLHVEHNLQVLTAAANIRKSNRHWPGMP